MGVVRFHLVLRQVHIVYKYRLLLSSSSAWSRSHLFSLTTYHSRLCGSSAASNITHPIRRGPNNFFSLVVFSSDEESDTTVFVVHISVCVIITCITLLFVKQITFNSHLYCNFYFNKTEIEKKTCFQFFFPTDMFKNQKIWLSFFLLFRPKLCISTRKHPMYDPSKESEKKSL